MQSIVRIAALALGITACTTVPDDVVGNDARTTLPVVIDDMGVALSGGVDLLVRDARIYVGAEEPRFVTTMAVLDERIVYLGDEAGASELEAARTLDLGGEFVIPGLHDVHQHTLEAHLPVVDCLVDERESRPERLGRAIARCPRSAGTDWVLGWGYSIDALLDAERPPRSILDDAHPDIPVAIMEQTSHSTWVNTRALELLGVDEDTPNPTGGIIVRDTEGVATGLLIDSAGELPWELALARTPALDELNYQALLDGMADNARNGITSAVDARTYVDRGYLAAYERADAENALSCRMVLALWASPLADDDEQIPALGALFRDEGGRVRVRQLKFYSDGLLENTTAALLEPYMTPDVLGPELGLNYFSEERLTRYLQELVPLGFDAHIHAIGDRAVRESLNAIAAVAGAREGAQHRLTHVELTEVSDIARFAELGVAADIQLGEHTRPGHLASTVTMVGQMRSAERAWVLGDLWRAGALVTLSSDYDVGDLNPFPAMAQALERGHQSLPNIEAALAAYTINGARVMGSAHDTGSLEIGKYADFVVIDRDIFSASASSIERTRVLWTVIGGVAVFRS